MGHIYNIAISYYQLPVKLLQRIVFFLFLSKIIIESLTYNSFLKLVFHCIINKPIWEYIFFWPTSCSQVWS